MYLIQSIVDWLVSVWIWSMTFGQSHFIIAPLLMWFGFKATAAYSFIKSLLIAIGAQLFSVLVLNILVVGIIIHLFHFEYSFTVSSSVSINVLQASMHLAIVYAVLQTIFFSILSLFKEIPLSQLIVITWIAHIITAFIMTIGVQSIMWYAV